MNSTARNLSVSGLLAISVVLLSACGQSPTTPNAVPSSGSPSAGNSVDPNAPEINPPGDIPDNQAFVTWQAPSGGYSLKVPEGWARSRDAEGSVFTDKLNSITVLEQAMPKMPSIASVGAALAGIKSASSGWVDGTIVKDSRTGGDVILATYQADAAPDPVTGKVVNDDVEQYTFWNEGKAVTLTLAGPHGADNVDPWRIVSDSFRWL